MAPNQSKQLAGDYKFYVVKPRDRNKVPQEILREIERFEAEGANADSTGALNPLMVTQAYGVFYVVFQQDEGDMIIVKFGHTWGYCWKTFLNKHPIKDICLAVGKANFVAFAFPVMNPSHVANAVVAEAKTNNRFESCPDTKEFFRIDSTDPDAINDALQFVHSVLDYKTDGEIFNAAPGFKNDQNLQNGQCQHVKYFASSKNPICPGVLLDDLLKVGPRCGLVVGSPNSGYRARSFRTDKSPRHGIMSAANDFFDSISNDGFDTAHELLYSRVKNRLIGSVPDSLEVEPVLDDLLKDPNQTDIFREAHRLPYCSGSYGKFVQFS